jgi:cyanophycinase
MSWALVNGIRTYVRNDVSVPKRMVVYPRLGNPEDDARPSHGPGLIFSGGHGHVWAAFRWAHKKIGGNASKRAGDVVIIRATQDNSYSSQFMRAARFNSAQTLAIPPDATEQELREAAEIVSKAELVFFAGGQQSRYLSWRGSPLMDAVQGVYDRGGVVGGTSAGLALMGDCVLGGTGVSSDDLTTQALLKNPEPGRRALVRGVFDFSAVKDIFTETHFRQRNRFGRLAVLLAEMKGVLGVAVDERTALLVDGDGTAHVVRNAHGGGDAYVVEADPRSSSEDSIHTRVHRLHSPDDWFDFKVGSGSTPEYRVEVDPQKPDHPYSDDPYSP